MPDEQRVDDIEKLLSDEKSMGDRKQAMIDDLLAQQAAAHASFNEKLAKLGYRQEPRPGDKMDDGTIYAGISPDTGKKVYAMPVDASLTLTFNEAKDYTQSQNTQNAYGHNDWHVPTRAELNVLFNNRAAIGGFSSNRSSPAGWYWSSLSYSLWKAWGQRFSAGDQLYYLKAAPSSVRLVRSEP